MSKIYNLIKNDSTDIFYKIKLNIGNLDYEFINQNLFVI